MRQRATFLRRVPAYNDLFSGSLHETMGWMQTPHALSGYLIYMEKLYQMSADHSMQKYNMTQDNLRAAPFNLFILLFGAGFLLLVFCLIFCCYFFRLKHQEQYRRRGYKKVVLKDKTKRTNLVGQMCAVCLEEFKVKEELGLCPCTHAFHTKCLMKWLEVRNACPMCNKTISVPIPRPSLEHM